ncbi:hypothetical protein C8R45DRAFT_1076899 [Mycena sanguinolenta]|nr:hypothetical protein C8R45DRAFT_1076899 [Mycena sanguinolenta]
MLLLTPFTFVAFSTLRSSFVLVFLSAFASAGPRKWKEVRTMVTRNPRSRLAFRCAVVSQTVFLGTTAHWEVTCNVPANKKLLKPWEFMRHLQGISSTLATGKEVSQNPQVLG